MKYRTGKKVHYCCDNCEDELGENVDHLYDYHGELLCAECLLARYDRIEADD